jgi:hypothetical protein
MRQIVTIPFSSWSNIEQEDNSKFLTKADNVVNYHGGYKVASGYTDLNQDTIINAAGVTYFFGGSFACLDKIGGKYNFIVHDRKVYLQKIVFPYSLDNVVYTATGTAEQNWQFCRFGENVIFSGLKEGVFKYELNVDATFSALGGTPPKAYACATVGDFVLLGNVDESGTVYANRVWNSAINDSTGWTAGTNLCDFTDIPEVAPITKIIGGEYATIFTQEEIVRMTFVGGDVIWQVDVLEKNSGCTDPNSIVKVGDLIYYSNIRGYWVFDGQVSRQLGKNYDAKYLTTGYGAYCPRYNAIIWSVANTLVVYSIEDDEFSEVFPAAFGYLIIAINMYTTNGLEAGLFNFAEDLSTVQTITENSPLTPDMRTAYIELTEGWSTITNVKEIADSMSASSITVTAYDDDKTSLGSKTITTLNGDRTRITGRYFIFKWASVPTTTGYYRGLKVTFEPGGKRRT